MAEVGLAGTATPGTTPEVGQRGLRRSDLRRSGLRHRLDQGLADLFATPVGPGFTWRGFALAVVAVAAGTGLSLLRQPGLGPFDTVWAEDGSVFLTDAAGHSTLTAITTSYAGYYHLIPRLLAEVATLLPADDAAAALSIEAALVTSLLAVLVYVASSGHLTSRLSRLLVAAVTLMLPLGMGDLPNSIANLHWPGLYTLFWLFMWTPRGRTGRIVASLTVLAIACSDILTPALLPLIAVRVLRRTPVGSREKYSWLLAGAFSVGFAVQVLGLLTGASSRHSVLDPVRVVTGYVVRAVPPGLLGERAFPSDVDTLWLVLAALAWLLVAGAVLAAWARYSRPSWALAVAATICGLALYGLPVVISGVATPRYAAAPVMLLVVTLTALLQPTGGRLRGRGAHTALAVLLVVVWIVNLRVDNTRGAGPGWREELDKARQTCVAGAYADVPIPPVESPPWLAHLPCDYIT